MKKVFVGGSRRVSRLNVEVKHRISRMIEKDMVILVGDASGADKAIQGYLAERSYRNVVVFCTGGQCRHNVGEWPTEAVRAPHKIRDFEFFTAKDAAMAHEADAGLMLWDGESTGTVVNVARMVAKHKPVVLYISPSKKFETVRSRHHLESVLSHCDPQIRQRIDQYIAQHASEYMQPDLFN